MNSGPQVLGRPLSRLLMASAIAATFPAYANDAAEIEKLKAQIQELGARGEFGSHAIRPHSRHHIRVMTVVFEAIVKLLPSSRRTPGSSVVAFLTRIR
ncbi:hypothetical protein MCEGEM3_01455 [Oxalobacteraceae bacterium]